MKKVILLVSALIFTFSAVAFAQTVPADKMDINLKATWGVKGAQKAVIYKHDAHVNKGKLTCDKCHKSAKGGDKIVPTGKIAGMTEQNAAHKFCWGCHKTVNPDPVKKVCTKCHTGK